MGDVIKKYETLILGVLGLVFTLIVMAWPDADFDKSQFVQTGMIIIGIVATSSTLGDGLKAFARTFDWKKEFLSVAALLQANGVKLKEEHIKLLAELLGVLDQQLEGDIEVSVEVGQAPELSV